MTGFEHQVASHMIAEGLVTEGLSVLRMIHDRYHPARRNPYNEVECSNHYARAMASYGSFIAACGFTHHGPAGRLGFAPCLFESAANRTFRSAFITCEGWGTYEQIPSATGASYSLRVIHGRVSLASLRVPLLHDVGEVKAVVAGRAVPARVIREESASGFGRIELDFSPRVAVRAGETLRLEV